MSIFQFHAGSTPLLISMPHSGREIPEDIAPRLLPHARAVPDTDWYVERLYDFAAELGASVIIPRYSRYVVDLNRAPDGSVLYPGASNTELCPTSGFDQRPLYREGQAPDAHEIARRTHRYWSPYHACLAQTVEELRSRHGYAILLDAHSIASRVPRFFAGQLPDFNLGTADGASCHPHMAAAALAAVRGFPQYSHVLDGRFKGGYITRHYGEPRRHIHAIQLELSQATYCREQTPGDYDAVLAARVKPCLRAFVQALLDWGQRHYGQSR
ncbi:MAG TPA: N-formylglutamate deformylase [Candidatus Competibacteraceae bacterium]|nr:N-formylglutamate deformylase [Candidatus Competibacteraceae bacterium]